MELTGKQILSVPQDRVWAALNDPAILRRCIPGCDSFEPSGENQYDIVMAVAVGPIKARFKGKLQLTDIQAPDSYTLNFDGSGGSAGFGRGTAKVSLAPGSAGTELAYAVQAKVGGNLAQVGARLIDGVAKKMADEFFTRFKTQLEPAAPTVPADPAGEAAPPAPPSQAAPAAWRRWAWAGGIAAAVLLIWLASGQGA